jgi:hypothetical protein
MTKKLKLTEFEHKVLSRIVLTPPNEIKLIPVDLYYSLLAYCEQEEDYERCIILRDISEKTVDMTIDEYYKVFDLV